LILVKRELRTYNGVENVGAGEGNIYIYNCFGVESANFIEWGTGVYKSTYDDWEASYGSETNSVEEDPLMVDPANGDFTLKSTSPAIDEEKDVGLTQDCIGNGFSGSTWDIGTYEYQKRLSPKNLRILKH
jgi:hypothetical protein